MSSREVEQKHGCAYWGKDEPEYISYQERLFRDLQRLVKASKDDYRKVNKKVKE